MAEFLKGNYRLPKRQAKVSGRRKSEKSLTQRFEEAALAKLGGSICFVVKDKTLLWTGDSSEETG